MNKATIDERVHAAIRPQLDQCDALLDHYLQDAPREVWEPIMEQITGSKFNLPPLYTPGLSESLDKAVAAFNDALQHPSMIADLTIMGLL